MTAVDDLAAWLEQVWKEQEKAEAGKHRRRKDAPQLAQVGPSWPGEDVITIVRDHGGREERMAFTDYLAEFCEPNPDPFVLARIAADRKILELHGGAHDCQEIRTGTYPGDWPEAASWGTPGGEWRHAVGEHFEDEPCPTVRLLALPNAGRSGYQEAWRPE